MTRRTTVLLLAALSWAVFSSACVEAPPEGTTAVDFALRTDNPVVVHSASSGTAVDGAISVRNHVFAAEPIMRISGQAPLAFVDRYEGAWVHGETSPLFVPGAIVPGSAKEPTTEQLTGFTFDLVLANEHSTIIFIAERFELRQTPEFQIESVVVDPQLVGEFYSTAGSRRHDDELKQTWPKDGPHLYGRLPSLNGRTSGQLHLYWTESTLQVNNSEQEFRSQRWEDAAAGPLAVRQTVWHELRATNASLDFSFSPNGAETALLFAKSVGFSGVQTISIAAADKINGALPTNAEPRGASLWINGDLDFQASAAEPPTSELRQGTYFVAVNGRAASISLGGGPIVPAAAGAAAASLVVGALVVILAIFRGSILELLGRTNLALFSLLRRDRILENPIRRTLYESTCANPGITFDGLRDVFRDGAGGRLGNGTTLHHLGVLLAQGFVRRGRLRGHRAYFPSDRFSGRDAAKTMVLHNHVNRALGRQIRQKPGIIQAQLKAVVGGSAATARQRCAYALRQMVAVGLVKVIADGRHKRYFAAPELSVLLDETRVGSHEAVDMSPLAVAVE